MTNIDGRTLNGVRYWIKVYCSKEETRAEGNRLKLALANCETGHGLQRGRMAGLRDSELEIALDTVAPLCEEGLPSEVNNNLLNRAAKTAKQNEDHDKVLELVDCFKTGAWDPKNPKLGAIPRVSMPDKINMFTTIYIKQVLVVLIGEGRPKMQEVLRMCRKAGKEHSLDTMDLLAFDRSTIASLNQALACWNTLELVLDPAAGAEFWAPQD